MFKKWRKYSYTDHKHKQYRIRWFVLWFLIFYVAYTLLTGVVFSARVLENDTMQPNLRAGDSFLFSSYTLHSFLRDINWLHSPLPIRRGNIVLVDKALKEQQSFFTILLDSVVRFFTAQRVSLTQKEHFYIKRVIGLPGDEITMTNYVFRIKPKGEFYTFTEFELWEKPYDVTIPQVPALWDGSIPFSGNMDTIVLGDNECFVLSDDRSNTNDSRTWGPVAMHLIVGKALFRYWPIIRLGRP
jgi:signal peptidase I